MEVDLIVKNFRLQEKKYKCSLLYGERQALNTTTTLLRLPAWVRTSAARMDDCFEAIRASLPRPTASENEGGIFWAGFLGLHSRTRFSQGSHIGGLLHQGRGEGTAK
jgi:hypothetical protein